MGIKREMGAKVERKLPITPDILRIILRGLDMNSIEDTAVWMGSLLAFYAMLRRSNFSVTSVTSTVQVSRVLKRSDVTLERDRVLVVVRWSKTIQFKDRVLTLPLPRMQNNPLCPFLAVARHYAMTQGAPCDGPAIVGSGQPLHPALTTRTFIQRIKSILQVNGYNSDCYSGHSFRRGGASHAYQQGVTLETVRQIGDWKSDAYLAYVFDNTESLLAKYQSWSATV